MSEKVIRIWEDRGFVWIRMQFGETWIETSLTPESAKQTADKLFTKAAEALKTRRLAGNEPDGGHYYGPHSPE